MPSVPAASARSSLCLALALALGLLFAGCSQTAPASPVAISQVDLPRSYRFAPEDITVGAGMTVTWTNHDNFTHSVRMLEGGDVQMMKPGESATHAFPAAGLFRYDCSLHPNDMRGSVLVTATFE
jgi:plastocyanin